MLNNGNMDYTPNNTPETEQKMPFEPQLWIREIRFWYQEAATLTTHLSLSPSK
jgi:hypothetical protein